MTTGFHFTWFLRPSDYNISNKCTRAPNPTPSLAQNPVEMMFHTTAGIPLLHIGSVTALLIRVATCTCFVDDVLFHSSCILLASSASSVRPPSPDMSSFCALHADKYCKTCFVCLNLRMGLCLCCSSAYLRLFASLGFEAVEAIDTARVPSTVTLL